MAMLLIPGCGGGESSPTNTVPLAVAGADRTVALGTELTLDGNGSSDADGDKLTYNWSIVSKPAGSNTTLSPISSSTPVLVSDIDGVYEIRLDVSDGNGNTSSDNINITARTASGVLDTSFGSDLDLDGNPDGFVAYHGSIVASNQDYGASIVLDSSGRIYVAGYSQSAPMGGLDMVVWRYTSLGTLDTTFGGGNGFVSHDGAAGASSMDCGLSITLDDSNRIYVTGFSYSSNPSLNKDMVIWRYTESGDLDTTFGSDNGFVVHHNAADGFDHDEGESITLDSDGKIYVAGHSVNAGGGYDVVIWRYTTAGVLDATFGGGAGYVTYHHPTPTGDSSQLGHSLTLDGAGRIYVTGYLGTGSEMFVLCYTKEGVLDTTFGGGDGIISHKYAATSNGRSIILDKSGRLYIVGYSSGGIVVWRYTTTGNPDTSFGGGSGYVPHNNAAGGSSNGPDQGYSLVLDPMGRIYVAGYGYNPAGDNDMVVIRYTETGFLDASFGVGKGFVVNSSAAGGVGNDQGRSIKLDLTGNLYIAGNSINADGNFDMVIWKYK